MRESPSVSTVEPVTAVSAVCFITPEIVLAGFVQLRVKSRVPLPRNEKRLAVPAFSLAVIVPVAGVVGVPPTAYVNWVGGVDLNPELKNVKCPTLVIANDTKRRSIAEFKAYQKKIPDSELVAIKVDGYHTAAVAPDECAQATLDFIARRGGGSKKK